MEKPASGVPPDGRQRERANAAAKLPMNPIIAFLKTTILGGLLFLIPLVLTIFLLREAIKFVGEGGWHVTYRTRTEWLGDGRDAHSVRGLPCL